MDLDEASHDKQKHDFLLENQARLRSVSEATRLRMVTKTQSYDMYESAQFKKCKAINEILEEYQDDDYVLGVEFEAAKA